jgi:hypothetical protein
MRQTYGAPPAPTHFEGTARYDVAMWLDEAARQLAAGDRSATITALLEARALDVTLNGRSPTLDAVCSVLTDGRHVLVDVVRDVLAEQAREAVVFAQGLPDGAR